MNFICEKNKLVEALSNVQKAVSQKSTIAALEGVLISTKENELEICAYNTELGIKTFIPAQIKKGGKIVLNAHLFTDIIRKLPNDSAEIEISENLIAKITSGCSFFELIGIDASEFPSLPNVENADCIELPVVTLKSMIKQTIFAVADTDSKPVHTGTLFEIKEKNITLVSVDGYRLAMRTEKIKEDMELSFVVPGKTLREVIRLLPDNDDNVKISAGMQHIVFYIGDYIVVSRLLDGEFLDYKSTIPEKSKFTVQVDTKNLVDSVERVSLLITDRLKSPVRCIFTNNRIHVSCITTIGKASDEIETKSDIKDELEIAFNNKYMLDALKNSDCDEMLICLNGPLNPIKIMPKTGNSFLFLVLPVRVKPE